MLGRDFQTLGLQPASSLPQPFEDLVVPPSRTSAVCSDMTCEQMHTCSTCVFFLAVGVLKELSPTKKALETRRAAELWEQSSLSATCKGCVQPPDRPGRDDTKV